MTVEELKELLPLYVAGSLSAEQKAEVRRALQVHPELEEDMRFWEGLRQATLIDDAFAKEGHLTAEQLVEYAEKTMPAGEERLLAEHHLRSCASCREELDLLQQISADFPGNETNRKASHFFPASLFTSKLLRPALAFALIAAAIIAGIYLNSDVAPVRQAVQPGVRETAAVVPPKENQVKRVALVLPLSTSLRHTQSSPGGLPVLDLDESTVVADVSMPVEHSAIAQGYVVELISVGGTRSVVADSVRPERGLNAIDTLRVSIGRRQFAGQGKYVLFVKEIVRKGVADIEPEEYRYDFEVKRTPPR